MESTQHKIVSSAEMRAIEGGAENRGISLRDVMQRAGEAIADAAAQESLDSTILVLVGPGNNGEDGLIASRSLHERNCTVRAYTYGRKDMPDLPVPVWRAEDDSTGERLEHLLRECPVVVDALLGAGQSRPPDGLLAKILEEAAKNRHHRRLGISVDIPTGVMADTGVASASAFHADVTVCMAFRKIGNVVFPGAKCNGEVRVADVGIPGDLASRVPLELAHSSSVAALFPSREQDGNKGSSGRLLVVGGSREFVGAPVLAAMAAYRAGSGLVDIALPVSAHAGASAHALEPIYTVLPEADGHLNQSAAVKILSSAGRARSVLLGSGMGLSGDTVSLTAEILQKLSNEGRRPIVIDADGLNALAQIPHWWAGQHRLVVTPHPGEMARLCEVAIDQVQSDRVGIAMQRAKLWNAVVVLKGAGTIVASPFGRAVVNSTGGPNLATAGTGDVLAGMIGGLLAQGLDPFPAAVAGVYLHGYAGDMLARRHGDVGTVASDLIDVLPQARLQILAEGDQDL